MSDQFEPELNKTHGFKKFTASKNKGTQYNQVKLENPEEMDENKSFSGAEKTRKNRKWTFQEDK